MRALKLEKASGSEKSITPEEKWIYGHSSCTEDEGSGQPATSSPATQDVSDSDDGDGDDESASGDSEESNGSDELYWAHGRYHRSFPFWCPDAKGGESYIMTGFAWGAL